MAATRTKLTSTPNLLAYVIVGDGTVGPLVIASATLIADASDGPLKDALSATYADQGAMRVAFFGNPCMISLIRRKGPVDTTGQANQSNVDVDVDAVTATRPEVNVEMSDTTGDEVYVILEHRHSLVR